MSFENGREGDRRRKGSASADGDTTAKSRSKERIGDAPELGSALRSVYDSTLNETIPPEMLDLLGKLG